MAEVLRLIVNYGHDIPEKFAIVYEYIKTRAKIIFKGNISRPLTICYGRTRAKPPSIKIKDISGITLKEFSEYVIDRVCTEHDGMLISKAQIVTALDIFKEIGLFARFKIKAVASGLTKVWSPFKTKVVAKVDIPVAIRTVYTTIVSKLIHKTNMEKAIEVYYAYPTNRSYKRIRNMLICNAPADTLQIIKMEHGDLQTAVAELSQTNADAFISLFDNKNVEAMAQVYKLLAAQVITKDGDNYFDTVRPEVVLGSSIEGVMAFLAAPENVEYKAQLFTAYKASVIN